MKPTAIATTIISALLIGSVLTACNQASSPDTQTSSAPDTSQTSSAPAKTPAKTPAITSDNTPQANSSTKPERNQERDQQRQQRRDARRKQIEEVLTPEQVQQLQARLKEGGKLRSAINSLNLTTDQKNKIQIIMEKSYEQSPDASDTKSLQ